ncbi:hypothetical protein M9Y10_010744 [Tritrichomonas musculus]|uniref:NADPH-dependent FMN reductase-like domain-containing protein n=1 Tax=Tritrichomonas musculus TaxID=1915356 RepID=A0ABR2ILL1_9EUKA
MSVVLLNGSPHLKGCTFNALNEVAKALNENGIKTEIFQVGPKPIAGCIGCFQCQKTGFCEQFKNDKVNEFIRLVDEKNFDGYVLGAPVYYAAANGSITSFLNRAFFASLQTKLVGKPGAAVVNARRGGCSATFDQLNKYFTISSMPVVSSLYWNETHGMTLKEQNEDREGMKTLKALGENMAWLIKSIKFGKENGIEFPKRKLIKPNEYPINK